MLNDKKLVPVIPSLLSRVGNVVNRIMQTEETSSESCPEVVQRDLASEKHRATVVRRLQKST